MASEDTEITLGVGKLLGLFFLLVAFCGVFFSIGYSLGRNSGREEVLQQLPAQTDAAAMPASAPAGSNDDKPSAVVAVKSGAEQPSQQEAPSNSPNPLTFYKAVQQVGVGGQGSQDAQPVEAPKTATKTPPGRDSGDNKVQPTNVQPAVAAAPPAGTGHAPSGAIAPVTGPGTFVVQIAAVMREDDAVALAGALRKKDYNVFVVNNPVTNDKFYHVQVGPFASLKDADAMKARLVAEGYNPIVKR